MKTVELFIQYFYFSLLIKWQNDYTLWIGKVGHSFGCIIIGDEILLWKDRNCITRGKVVLSEGALFVSQQLYASLSSRALRLLYDSCQPSAVPPSSLHLEDRLKTYVINSPCSRESRLNKSSETLIGYSLLIGFSFNGFSNTWSGENMTLGRIYIKFLVSKSSDSKKQKFLKNYFKNCCSLFLKGLLFIQKILIHACIGVMKHSGKYFFKK